MMENMQEETKNKAMWRVCVCVCVVQYSRGWVMGGAGHQHALEEKRAVVGGKIKSNTAAAAAAASVCMLRGASGGNRRRGGALRWHCIHMRGLAKRIGGACTSQDIAVAGSRASGGAAPHMWHWHTTGARGNKGATVGGRDLGAGGRRGGGGGRDGAVAVMACVHRRERLQLKGGRGGGRGGGAAGGGRCSGAAATAARPSRRLSRRGLAKLAKPICCLSVGRDAVAACVAGGEGSLVGGRSGAGTGDALVAGADFVAAAAATVLRGAGAGAGCVAGADLVGAGGCGGCGGCSARGSALPSEQSLGAVKVLLVAQCSHEAPALLLGHRDEALVGTLGRCAANVATRAARVWPVSAGVAIPGGGGGELAGGEAGVVVPRGIVVSARTSCEYGGVTR